ncbi:hypothetical protein CEXT_495621 [Caerostris extrusa]|uniref:Uncharacterized protein n=1 Tax=Caerostris extrusa TaxID=172846 RepID=A0AAV4TEK0_CAEEX|nr:hypothetical protein CEXT_495621 [Caerostris extrusa]
MVCIPTASLLVFTYSNFRAHMSVRKRVFYDSGSHVEMMEYTHLASYLSQEFLHKTVQDMKDPVIDAANLVCTPLV